MDSILSSESGAVNVDYLFEVNSIPWVNNYLVLMKFYTWIVQELVFVIIDGML